MSLSLWRFLDGKLTQISMGGNDSIKTYSTAEQWTGLLWSPTSKGVFQKTVNCGALPNSTSKSTAHNIANVSSWINVFGVAVDSSANGLILPFASPTAANSVSVSLTPANVVIQTGSNLSAYSAYITLFYTCTDR